MGRHIFGMIVCLSLWGGSAALAEWRIDVESKTVPAGADSVTVAVRAHWSEPLTALTLPIIVRAVTLGSFWTGALPYDTGGNGYLHPYQHQVKWYWDPAPFAGLVEEFQVGLPRRLCNRSGDKSYDGIAPDHFVINVAGVNPTPEKPDGWKFLEFTFDVTDTPGSFEFDTACFTSSLHTIFMVDNSTPPRDHGPSGSDETSFNKGVITISAKK
jgi:hypothetical protein